MNKLCTTEWFNFVDIVLPFFELFKLGVRRSLSLDAYDFIYVSAQTVFHRAVNGNPFVLLVYSPRSFCV